ncbi:CD3337/EF1877 family mobilome membrane protein [Bacillus cereus group sp. BceL098]|uniref:CD3337/EF1877 family mobilome membrane protein n=1 Tax=unclassified Bacillus cereus group TaxID=2750818 RepID=UPI003F2337FF
MKKLFPLFMAIFILFVGTVPNVAFAEDEPKASEANTISGNLFDKSKQEDFENVHYEIDTAPHKDDEKGFFSKAWGYMFGDDSVGKDIQRKINGVGQWIVSLMFQFGVWLTKILLFIVEQSFSLDIIDVVADKLGKAMQNIAGIGSKPEFESEGLFPSIIKMTCILSVIYFIYLFFVKRQMTKGISELFKVVCVIAGILVYIANAPVILKGMNTISSEISLQVLSKTTGTIHGNPGQTKSRAIANVKAQMWELMVERPYLYLQYGQDSLDTIGVERVNKLINTPPGEDRVKLVTEDVKEHKNFMMTNESVGERLIFTFMYYIVNTFAGAPTAVICLLIVACQLLFMVMSIIGPIAMAFALLPKNRRVLISWAEQWLKPLAAKIFLSLIVIILFSIAGLLYELPEAGTSGYLMTMILQILVFVLCYIFRDNIKAAFRKSKVAYNSFTDLEYMAGKTKDGFNRTMDGINAGVGRAKDMFGDSDPNYMGDDPSEHTADESGTKQATLDEEKVSGESEEEKTKYASIGEEDEQTEQHQDEEKQDEEEQERATIDEDEDEVVVNAEQEETEEYQEDQEEVNPDNLASLEGVEEENPELSEVEDAEQPEQDDPSQYENQEGEDNNEELSKINEEREGTEKSNSELPDVEAQEQGEQDDPSDYETENQEGNNEELATVNGNGEEENPELSDVEDIEQPEQDDPSQYENQEGEDNDEELSKIREEGEGANQNDSELPDVEAPEQGEQDDPSDYETENQEENNEELATMNGNDGEEENPELSDVEDIKQPEQDDPSDYETEQDGGNGEVLVTTEETEVDSAQNNEPLSDVETPEQVEQDDSSNYEAGYEEGNAMELATTEESTTDSQKENMEVSDVETPEQVEQDDSSNYEAGHGEGNTMELATTEESTMDSQKENTEVSDIETSGHLEQDNVSEYETENGEGASNQIASVGQLNSSEGTSNSTGKSGEIVPSLDEKQGVINPSGIDQESGSENEFVLNETNGKELTSTKGLETKSSTKTEGFNLEGSPIGNGSTKVSSVGEFNIAEPSGMGVNTESMNVNDIQGASVESSGDLTMTSPDSLESSGSIPGQTMNGSSLGGQGVKGQTMNGNSLGEQEVKGQSFEGSQVLQRQGSSQEIKGAMEAKPSEHVESSQADKINRTNETTHIESAQAEVAAAQEIMIDATQQKVELETLAEENEIKIETETETI